MSNYKPQWFQSPIDLPEAQSGKMRIAHRIIPKGETVQIVGGRQSVLRGLVQVQGRVKKPLRIHELREQRGKFEGVWMTDLPEELNQIGEMLHTVRPQGRVLIGGLGLGILAKSVYGLDGVTDVTVVERSADVIKLVASNAPYKVVRSDITDYLRNRKTPFDYYLLDTWQGTNETTWWSQVMPLRRIIRNKFGTGPEIHCWAEDIMWAQVGRSLEVQGTHGKPYWYYEHLPCPMDEDEVNAFLNMVGTPWWEKHYGAAVDKALEPKERRASHG